MLTTNLFSTRHQSEKDFLKTHGEELLEAFVDPIVIRHPKGHTVPRLDDKSLEIMLDYLQRIEEELEEEHTTTDEQ